MQVHVVLRERAQDHELGRLLEFAALAVDVRHAGGALPGSVEIDFGDVAARAI